MMKAENCERNDCEIFGNQPKVVVLDTHRYIQQVIEDSGEQRCVKKIWISGPSCLSATAMIYLYKRINQGIKWILFKLRFIIAPILSVFLVY